MFFTLLDPDPKPHTRLLRYLFRLSAKNIRPVLILPKHSVSMEEGLKLGKLLSRIRKEETSPLLGFAESFVQAVAFCKEVSKGRLGVSGRVLPIFVNATRLSLPSGDSDLGEEILQLGENWERIFPLTCFLELGRSSSRLEEASGRTSLFRVSTLVLEAMDKGWKKLKEEKTSVLPEEWSEELISSLLPPGSTGPSS